MDKKWAENVLEASTLWHDNHLYCLNYLAVFFRLRVY